MRQVNPFDRPPSGGAGSGIRAELRATLSLAAPLSAANIALIAMAVTNTVMVARLGTIPLAASGLGGMFYFIVGIVSFSLLNCEHLPCWPITTSLSVSYTLS